MVLHRSHRHLLLLLSLVASLARATPPVEERRATSERPRIDVVFVLDTTSSMSGLIEGAKEKIWSIASSMARGQPTPRIRVGLVAFRDRGDAYLTQRFDLTEDLDAVYGKLRGFRAEGGGDTPESVGQGLGEAVKFMSWNDDKRTMKMVFLVGDAPAHDYHDGWELFTWAKNAAEKGISVNTVRCGNSSQTEQQWRQVARLADGSFISIGQTGGMVAVSTPFDEKMAKVSAEIAGKTVYGGAVAAQRASEKRKADMASMKSEAAADRASFFAKSAGAGGMASAAPAAVAGGFDLTAEPERAAALADDQLPADLQKLPKAERKERLAKLQAERKQLETELTQLARQRDEYLAKQAAPKTASFDSEVMGQVKSKAARYGISY